MERSIVVVCGAHLLAERFDRAHAGRLAGAMEGWLREHGEEGAEVVICTDLWYLNNRELRSRPTASIGAPGVSALGAYLLDKLPTALTVDGVLSVQMDLEFVDVVANLWGSSHEHTGRAVDEFINRYLDAFMEKAAARCAAEA